MFTSFQNILSMQTLYNITMWLKSIQLYSQKLKIQKGEGEAHFTVRVTLHSCKYGNSMYVSVIICVTGNNNGGQLLIQNPN